MAADLNDTNLESPADATAPDPNDHFRTDHLQADLKGRSVRGGVVTMSAQGAKFFLTLVSTVVLARLLVPGDFGLVAMVTVVTGFVSLFKDMGLSMATVQRAEINHAQTSTLFWINVTISVAIGLIVAALSVPISWFYREPRLVAITLVLAVGMPLSGLGIQHQALLRRQMRFTALAAVQTVSMLCGIVVAIALAAVGKFYWPTVNYWSLVALPLTTAAAGTLGVWIACRWRPGRPRRGSGVRAPLSFGGYLTGFNLINYFGRNLDNVLIGRFWGEVSLGLYSQAYRLLLLPIQQINAPITAIAIPVLSRLADTPERYRAYYRQGILLIASIGMPIVAFSFVAADDLILLALGPQWTGAAAIFRALAPAAFIGTFNVAAGWILISLGRTKRQFKLGLVATFCYIIGFVVGLPWGALGVAISFSIVVSVLQLPILMYCFHNTPVKLKDFGLAIIRPAVASLSTAGVFLLSTEVFGLGKFGDLYVEVFVQLILFAVTFAGIWIGLPNGKSQLQRVLSLLTEFRLRSR